MRHYAGFWQIQSHMIKFYKMKTSKDKFHYRLITMTMEYIMFPVKIHPGMNLLYVTGFAKRSYICIQHYKNVTPPVIKLHF